MTLLLYMNLLELTMFAIRPHHNCLWPCFYSVILLLWRRSCEVLFNDITATLWTWSWWYTDDSWCSEAFVVMCVWVCVWTTIYRNMCPCLITRMHNIAKKQMRPQNYCLLKYYTLKFALAMTYLWANPLIFLTEFFQANFLWRQCGLNYVCLSAFMCPFCLGHKKT